MTKKRAYEIADNYLLFHKALKEDKAKKERFESLKKK